MSKSDKSTTVRTGGVGFLGLLGLVFITLKLLGITAVASWSWVWVLAPIWIPFVSGLIILAIVVVIMGIASK